MASRKPPPTKQGYLLSVEDREVIRRLLADRRATLARQPRDSSLPGDDLWTPEVYVARAPDDPGGGIAAYDGVTVSSANCYVYREIEGVLTAVEDVFRTVFNLSACTVAAGSWIHSIRDKFGTWWAVDVCQNATTTTSSTTTSTTTTRTCTGSCRWQCVSGVWVETSPGCSTGCVCQSPSYCCGTCGDPHEQTVTQCISGGVNPQPDCSGTTTTTTSGTTTTTVDCTKCVWKCRAGQWYKLSDGCGTGPNCLDCLAPGDACSDDCDEVDTSCRTTTTTRPPACTGSCTWFWDDQWYKTADNCDGGIRGCNCSPPSVSGDECGNVALTPCVEPPDGTTPPPWTTTTPSGCTGQCRWQWSVSLGQWVLACTDCPSGCTCAVVPFYDGTSDHETAVEPCQETTTTSTTTTSSTTTSTTTSACGTCLWTCQSSDGGLNTHWQLSTDSCTGSCDCTEPTASPCTYGLGAVTNCGTTTTTSTTTTSTTTTSTTTCTTTSSPPPSCGTCKYGSFGGGDPWHLRVDLCTAGCGCVAPACDRQGTGGGEQFLYTNCSSTTTTTTTTGGSTTSTTTTTTTTAATTTTTTSTTTTTTTSGAPVTVACCGSPIKTNLQATVTGTSALNGVYYLAWDGLTGWYSIGNSACGTLIDFALLCSGSSASDFELTVACTGGNTIFAADNPTASACPPSFSLTFVHNGNVNCCVGNVTVTITAP